MIARAADSAQVRLNTWLTEPGSGDAFVLVGFEADVDTGAVNWANPA